MSKKITPPDQGGAFSGEATALILAISPHSQGLKPLDNLGGALHE